MPPKQRDSLAREINRMAMTVYGDEQAKTIGLCERQRLVEAAIVKMNGIPARILQFITVLLSLATFTILAAKQFG